jgi:hypothetical protein
MGKTKAKTGSGRRAKGAIGEREWAKFCTARGFPLVRGRQYCGGQDSPDCKLDRDQAPHPLSELFHAEVKRVELLNIHSAFDQATRDAKGKHPYVAFRRNHSDWKVCISGELFLELIRRSDLMDGDDGLPDDIIGVDPGILPLRADCSMFRPPLDAVACAAPRSCPGTSSSRARSPTSVP